VGNRGGDVVTAAVGCKTGRVAEVGVGAGVGAGVSANMGAGADAGVGAAVGGVGVGACNGSLEAIVPSNPKGFRNAGTDPGVMLVVAAARPG